MIRTANGAKELWRRGHCRKDLLNDVYKDHCSREQYKTAAMTANLKACGLRPCLHIPDTVTCTKVEACCHVIVWTKILCDNGYRNLDQLLCEQHPARYDFSLRSLS